MAADRKAKSSYQQELERRANDILRIYNPTNERHVVVWDAKNGPKRFPVEAKEEAVHPRYIAEKYMREMFQKILNDKAREAILNENERRIKSGMAEMDKTMKTNEQMAFEEKFYNPSDEEAKRIIALLYLGVESEYGVDRVSADAQKDDKRPVFERAMEEVQETKDSGGSTDTTNGEKTQENAPGKADEAGKSEFTCEICGFSAKSNIGLISHKRTHRDELENKKQEVVKNVSK